MVGSRPKDGHRSLFRTNMNAAEKEATKSKKRQQTRKAEQNKKIVPRQEQFLFRTENCTFEGERGGRMGYIIRRPDHLAGN